ncbi:MAG: PASTA domain-containing protein [Treponema sp.]|nr:PASTA domain-containing protein [Treponema sp.]
MSDEIEKKEKKPFKFGLKFVEGYEKLQSNIPVLIITCVTAFIVMVFVALVVFFNNVKGAEKVLVPNVIGKSLEDALLEMQVKELYPKINLRYSDTPGDEGTILEQEPEAGAIVKGYSRVSLVVSRGVIVDKVENYIGMSIDEVQMRLQTLFAGQTKPLIVLADPEYKPDTSDAGTILEQDPPAGTSISEPVTVQLIVSRGPNYENTKAPYVIGESVNDLLQRITRSKLVFDISSHTAKEGETPGTVVDQQTFDSEFVPNYTRVTVEMAMPSEALNDNIYGVFTATLADYPYPVPMKLDAKPAEGDSYTIVSFAHPGGNVTIPYAVPKGTQLVLTVVDKVVSRKTVN